MAEVTGSVSPNSDLTPATTARTNLRPVKAVLSKLRFDINFDEDDFVIGYIERKKGIVEMPVKEWRGQESQDCVAYFRDVMRDRIVWERVSKVDFLGGER